MKPLISVVIPAYNEEQYIGRSIDSINRQRFDPSQFETIVVANGCRDDTAGSALRGADKVIATPIKGVAHAKDLGEIFADGEVICFMDADSVAEESLLERVYESVSSGYVGGKAKLRPIDGVDWRAHAHCWYSEALSRVIENYTSLSSGAGAFTFVTRDVFDKMVSKDGFGFDAKRNVLEDVDFMMRMKQHGKFKFITDSFIYTSMRRFTDEGYFANMVNDFREGVDPENATRKRWE